MDNQVQRVKSREVTRADSGEPGYMSGITRRDGVLTVTSQKCLGIQPGVRIEWSAPQSYWSDGFRLMVFRSTTGFSAEDAPEDLARHGQMILEERADGTLEEHLPEGTHYYTLVLQRFLHLLWVKVARTGFQVRFSETIPSAKVAIGRIEDQVRLNRLHKEHELDLIRDQVAHNDAIVDLHRSNKKLRSILGEDEDGASLEADVRREVDKRIRSRLVTAHTKAQLALEWERLRKDLRKHPGWKKLTKAQRERIINDAAEKLDADEEDLRV